MKQLFKFRLPVLVVTAALVAMPVFAQKNIDNVPVKTTIVLNQPDANPNHILYKPARYLKISDFRGVPAGRSSAVGSTYSGIELSWKSSYDRGKAEAQVEMVVYFDRSHSWMKPEGRTERVLKHEQIHFDLTAIKACALYHAIQNERFTVGNIKKRIRSLQNRYVTELQEEQHRYDKETKHGTIPEKQQEWADRVARLKAGLDCM